MFTSLHDKFCDELELVEFTGGVIGDVLDFGVPRRIGEGYPFYIYLASRVELTATGNPSITVTLETSDDKTFASPADITSHPLFSGLAKGDFGPKGRPLAAPAPFGTKRYGRLNLTTSSAITCATIDAGFTYEPQTAY